jgi:hypothetical protein
MKAIILDGSQDGDAALEHVRHILLAELLAQRWDSICLPLCDLEIHDCLGCFGCWVQTPGVCVMDDAGRDVARQVIGGDLAVFLTPVTFGGYSSQLKKAVDRLICLISPFFTRINGEVHHKPRYRHYPRLLGVGVLPEADGESERIFAALVGRNALNMHAPVHAAGLIHSRQGRDAIQAEIRALLRGMEVDQ